MSRGQYPNTRMRRNRMQAFSRRLVAENRLSTDDLIWPLFVIEGKNQSEAIDTMPDVSRHSIDRLLEKAHQAVEFGIPAIAIFPSIDSSRKDSIGSIAQDGDNLVCRAVRAIKSSYPDLGVVCDVALDPFTDHGHDGIMKASQILNDETIAILCQQAIHQANAGCDIIAPSDMMDGRIKAIRLALEKDGFNDTLIMSYAAKFASAFYGPFRDAVGAKGLLKGDKKTYQIDPSNREESLREVGEDILEGADMVMVKPGMPYLDIISEVKQKFNFPTFAYQVSGEYSMLRGAIENNWLENDKTIIESLTCFKRAGCEGILTYFAPEAAKILDENNE